VLKAQDYYPRCPETLVVALARTGDRKAFENLVERRQSSVRSLMRRFCGDATLADDLAQQVFLHMWLKIRMLKNPLAFPAWLKRLAVTVWLQYLRKHDALRNASEFRDFETSEPPPDGIDMDLDQGLATLPPPLRLCIVLSYQEGMSHAEIAELLDMPLGTVKSHINRGTTRLQQVLSAYRDRTITEESS
jgi:RNA polymerase sigma-70 factor (ECF subfamily)